MKPVLGPMYVFMYVLLLSHVTGTLYTSEVGDTCAGKRSQGWVCAHHECTGTTLHCEDGKRYEGV